MKYRFNFRTGDTPLRLIADTLGLLAVIAFCWLAWGLTP
ncbi:MAG: hypothetical protein Dbin4_02622 [Alphaproteobacteria bacterium]|nr:hypothetical protein [Alphaproteobacteria bacterium]